MSTQAIIGKYLSFINQGTFDVVGDNGDVFAYALNFMTKNEISEMRVAVSSLLNDGEGDRKMLELISQDNLDFYLHDEADIRCLFSHILEISRWYFGGSLSIAEVLWCCDR